MSAQDVASYRVVFIKSALDHLNSIKSNLPNLSNPDLSESVLEEIYIHIHSLKGSSGVMGYSPISEICSEIDILIHPPDNYLKNKDEFFPKISGLINKLESEILNIENSTIKI